MNEATFTTHNGDIMMIYYGMEFTGYMTWPMLLNRGVMFRPIVNMFGLKCGCFIEMVDPKNRHIQKHQMRFFKHTKSLRCQNLNKQVQYSYFTNKSLNNLMKSVTLWQFNIAAENGGFLKWGYPKSPWLSVLSHGHPWRLDDDLDPPDFRKPLNDPLIYL